MSNLPSDSPDAEVVQTGLSGMHGWVMLLGIIGFVGLNSSGIGSLLICGFSALAIVGAFILKVKPIWRMKFSIRTMLIVVTVIAIGAAGYQLWVQSTTEYQLEGTISFAIEDFSRINSKNEAASWPKRFSYDDPDAANTARDVYPRWPVTGDKSIVCWIGFGTITYKTTANYDNWAKKFDDLETLLKKTERLEMNSDLHFHKIWIGENQNGNFRLIKELLLDTNDD